MDRKPLNAAGEEMGANSDEMINRIFNFVIIPIMFFMVALVAVDFFIDNFTRSGQPPQAAQEYEVLRRYDYLQGVQLREWMEADRATRAFMIENSKGAR